MTMDIWWISLAIFVAVVVVVAILLGLIIGAARSIDGHAAQIWLVGKQIAGNTVTIWTLEQTNEHLRRLGDAAQRLERTLAKTEDQQRASRPGG